MDWLSSIPAPPTSVERWREAKEHTACCILKELGQWLNRIIHWHGVSRGYTAQKQEGKKYLSDILPDYSQLKFRWYCGYGCLDVVIEGRNVIDDSWILSRFYTRDDEFRVFGQKEQMYTTEWTSWATELAQSINETIKATLTGIMQENNLCICKHCGYLSVCELIWEQQWLCKKCSKQIHPLDKIKKPGGLIYYVTTALSSDIKIGWAKTNVEQRIATFCLPEHQILATEKGDRLRESELHRKFCHGRIGNSEWFRPVPELLAHIASCNQSA